jgi:hypothetical protein
MRLENVSGRCDRVSGWGSSHRCSSDVWPSTQMTRSGSLTTILAAVLALSAACRASQGSAGLADALDSAANGVTMSGGNARMIEYRHQAKRTYVVAFVPPGGLSRVPAESKGLLKAEHCDSMEAMIIVTDIETTECVTQSRIRIPFFRLLTMAAGEATGVTIQRDDRGPFLAKVE